MVVGPDEADKLASVIGACVGLAALMVSVYGVFPTRRATGPGAPLADQSVADSTVGGGVTQVRDVTEICGSTARLYRPRLRRLLRGGAEWGGRWPIGDRFSGRW